MLALIAVLLVPIINMIYVYFSFDTKNFKKNMYILAVVEFIAVIVIGIIEYIRINKKEKEGYRNY